VKLAVVVVTYNCEAGLAELAGALRGVLDGDDEVLLVDNASSDGTAASARALGLPIVEAGSNLGFGAACRIGADATSAPLLLFLNPDARPQPGSLERLRAVADERPDWAAWQPAVMLPDGRINSAGGVVHYLGLSWAGRCEQPASELADAPYEVPFASGAALVIRRGAWTQLDGFDDSYFLYGEDCELGLRLWLIGHRVGVEPRARVLHDYVFDKGPRKWFLLERNRWRTVVALYPARLLALLAPALLVAELGLLLVAARDGWLIAKLRANLAATLGVRRALRRRAAVQAQRRIDDAAFAGVLTGSLDSPYLRRLPSALVRAQSWYFSAVRLLLRLIAAAPVRIAGSAGEGSSGWPEDR
jgi:N-acetylglucosaminyl-diphospho-decaprenol L-rhamnosyltransferase